MAAHKSMHVRSVETIVWRTKTKSDAEVGETKGRCEERAVVALEKDED